LLTDQHGCGIKGQYRPIEYMSRSNEWV